MGYRLVCPFLSGGLAVVLAVSVSARPGAPAAAPPGVAEQPESVSLVRLIANPDAYDGKMVRVFGYVRVEHEGTAVYLHRDDCEHMLTKNGLWLAAGESTPPGSREAAVNNRYALIEGRFSAKETGHRGLWSGSVRQITRMEPWEIRKGGK
ncbi:MAG TPA: hypothetical protein VH092_00650 [Urbifossiella sp.]|jgi:hypothetical protein|nr:hypothetical protein [Urbifossiella sp.]